MTYASPSCAKVLGHQPEVMLDAETGPLVHEADLEHLRSTLRGIEELPGESVEFSMRVRHQNGSWRWLEGIATNLFADPDVDGHGPQRP